MQCTMRHLCYYSMGARLRSLLLSGSSVTTPPPRLAFSLVAVNSPDCARLRIHNGGKAPHSIGHETDMRALAPFLPETQPPSEPPSPKEWLAGQDETVSVESQVEITPTRSPPSLGENALYPALRSGRHSLGGIHVHPPLSAHPLLLNCRAPSHIHAQADGHSVPLNAGARSGVSGSHHRCQRRS